MNLLNQRYDPAVPVRDLSLHPENPREGNIGLISRSIADLGFYGAAVAQMSTGFILAGNHRYQSALENDAETIPVIWVDVTDDTARRILLMDNRASDTASNNEPALADLLRSIAAETGTLDGTGYTGDDLDDLIAGLETPYTAAAAAAQAPGAPASGTTAQQPGTAGAPRTEWRIELICASAAEQQAVFEELVQSGKRCRKIDQ